MYNYTERYCLYHNRACFVFTCICNGLWFFFNLPARMPGERLTVRNSLEVGRFPGAAPPTKVELIIQNEEDKKAEEGCCRRWLRNICPCCCRRQTSTSYDFTDKVEFVKPPAPEPDKPPSENGEAKELEGNERDCSAWSTVTTCLNLHIPLSFLRNSAVRVFGGCAGLQERPE